MKTTRRSDEIADELIEDLRRGAYAIGDALPAEMELCERFGASRGTVRSALIRLQGLGLIRRHQGAPTRVVATEVAPTYVHSMTAAGDLLDFSAPSVRQVREIEPLIADEELAPKLDNRPGRHWVRIGQTRHLDNDPRPMVWSDVYIAREYGDIAEEARTYPGLVYTLLEQRHGVIIDKIRQTVDATKLSEDEAILFEDEPEASALRITRRYVDIQERCWIASISILPASRFSLKITLKRQV